MGFPPFGGRFGNGRAVLHWASLLLAGVSATGGQFFITAAYRFAPAKEIAVFDYSQVLFAALLGFFFLHELPDVWSFAGYFIIIGAAAGKQLTAHLLFKREKRSAPPAAQAETDETAQKENASPPAPPTG